MNILVVGGTGPIGGYAALHLSERGHDVTISSRNPPTPGTGLEALPWLAGNYIEETFGAADLKPFEAIVFAAGSDMRHVPHGADAGAHYLKANGEMVGNFAALAKSGGVRIFIHVGSFYPQVVPDMIETDDYVRSRHLADKAVCALSDHSFRAMSLNAPFVIGMPKGMKNDMFNAHLGYARKLHCYIKDFGPAGGSNFLSVKSLAEAIEGAIARGIGGTSYLLGDESLSFADYFQKFFDAAGNPAQVLSLDEEHPMMPDVAIIPGRGSVVDYEPDAREAALLGYSRNDISRTVAEIVETLDAINGMVEPVELSANAQNVAEIRLCAERYARAMDRNDVAMLKNILADDPVISGPGFRFSGSAEVHGIPGILEMIFKSTQHVVTQQLCDVDGETAKAETYCQAHHVLPADRNGEHQLFTCHIRYQDHLVRDGSAWRFKQRGLIYDWIEAKPIVRPL